MNRSVLLLAGSTLIFGSASAYLWREERAADERNAALEARVQQLENQLTVAARTLPPPAPTVTTLIEPSTAPTKRLPVAPLVKSASGTQSAVLTRIEASPPPVFRPMRMDKMMQDPEYRAAMRSQHRMMMHTRYPDLSEVLHLQPEEIDKLMDLLTDQEMENMNRQPPFFTDGQPPDQAAMREWSEKVQKQQRENEAALGNLLGSNGLQEWKDYQQTLGARMEVKQLRNVMDGSSDPIRADQVQPLVEAIAGEQRRQLESVRSRANAYGGGTIAGIIAPGGARTFTRENQVTMMEQSLQDTEQRNQRLHDAVAPYLSSRQLDQFDRHQKQQLDMQRASLRMMRATAEAEARGEIPNNNGTMALGASSVFVPATP